MIALSERVYQIQRVLGATPPSSFPPIKLNTFTIRDSCTHTLADLLEILCSFPHLTNLVLSDVVLLDLRMIADYTWRMWDMRHFPARGVAVCNGRVGKHRMRNSVKSS